MMTTDVAPRIGVGSLPIITISVTSYNSADDLLALLDSIHDSDGILEILIHENGRDDFALSADLALSPQVQVHLSPVNRGFGGGHNANLRKARGRYFAILNPDMTIDVPSLQRLCASLDAHPHASAVAPRLRLPSGELQITTRKFPGLRYELASLLLLDRVWPRVFSTLAPVPESVAGCVPVKQVAGAALVCRTEDLLAIGGFDETFFVYFEDVDLCRRLQTRIGVVLLDTDTSFMHRVEGTARRYRWQTTALIELSRQLYHRKSSRCHMLISWICLLRCWSRALALFAAGTLPHSFDARSKAKGYAFAATHLIGDRVVIGVELIRADLS